MIQFRSEWGQFLHPTRWNWLTFTPAACELEWDRSMGSVSLRLALLGLHCIVSYTYNPRTELRCDLLDMLAEAETSIAVPAKDYAAYRAWKDAQ